MKTREEILAAAERVSKEVRFLIFEEKRWEICKSSKQQFKVYKAPSPSGSHHVFKAEDIINDSPEKVFDFLHPSEPYKAMWDPHGQRTLLLQELSRDVILLNYQLKPILLGILSARDSIDVCTIHEGDDFKSIEFGSINHDDYPPTTKCVRAWTYPTGVFVFRTEEPEKSRVVILFQADVKTKHMPPGIFEAVTPTLLKEFFTALHKIEFMKWVPLQDVPGRRKQWPPECSTDKSKLNTQVAKDVPSSSGLG